MRELTQTSESKLCRVILELSDACQGDTVQLEHLHTLASIVNQLTDDENTITFDLKDYLQESIEIAHGNGDSAWLRQLRNSLESELLDEE